MGLQGEHLEALKQQASQHVWPQSTQHDQTAAKKAQLIQQLQDMGMQGEHLEALKEQAKGQQQLTQATNKTKLKTQFSQQATYWQRQLVTRKQEMEWYRAALERAEVACQEAVAALEAAEESLKSLVLEEDGAGEQQLAPQVVAATAASVLEEGVGVLKALLQQEDWESVPAHMEESYNKYVRTQSQQGKQVLGTHKWYVTEHLLPATLEGILRTL